MTHIFSKSPKLSVWVNSQSNDLEYALMEKAGFDRAVSLHKADILLFVGGADVNPLLYNENPLVETRFDVQRDEFDMLGYRAAESKFKVGICRGGQFLNVMNGGRMWQDVNNHALVHTHKLTDAMPGKTLDVTSTHHQMMRPTGSAIVIGTAREATYKKAETQRWLLNPNIKVQDENKLNNYFKIDHEVLYYPGTRSLSFQPHPEYGTAPAECKAYFDEVIHKALDGTYTNWANKRKAKAKEAKA